MPGKRNDKRLIEVQADLFGEPCVDATAEAIEAAIRDMHRQAMRDRLASIHRARRSYARWFRANPLPKGGA